MSRYGLVGPTTNDLLTYGGRVIVHNDKAEMEWLFPSSRIVRLSDGDVGPTLRLRDHPRFKDLDISWPLKREDFW